MFIQGLNDGQNFCDWLIEVEAGYAIEVTVTAFDVSIKLAWKYIVMDNFCDGPKHHKLLLTWHEI